MSRAPKILVINLTRLGDVLQSTALLRALKERHPEPIIHYLAVDRFAEVCRHIPEIDQVIPFNLESALKASKEAMSQLSRRLTEAAGFVKTLREGQYQTVINLSHSRISALLCHLLNVADTRGLVLDREGFRQIRHPWANYFFTANLNRSFNRFNSVDINLGLARDDENLTGSEYHGKCGGSKLSFQIPEEARQKAQELLSSTRGGKRRLLIGFQPGASLANKRWPSSSFAELGRRLKENVSAHIVILGSPKETALAAEIAQSLGIDVLNLAGQTDIPLLAACLEKLDLLISNDTGTQHLAAAVDTPVLSLCFGSALSHETGPYGKGHLVVEPTISCFPCSFHVECPRFRCQEQVGAEAICRLAAEILKSPGRSLEIMDDGPIFQTLRVWRTDFDPEGFWIERPLFKRRLTGADLINLVSREVWKETLTPSKCELSSNKIEQSLELLLQDYEISASASLSEEIGKCLMALERLQACANIGLGYCRELREEASSPTADLNKIRRWGDLLAEEDRTINLIGASHPEVNNLSLDFVWGKQNLQGHDLTHLTTATEHLYDRLCHLAARHKSAITSVAARWNLACSTDVSHEESQRVGA